MKNALSHHPQRRNLQYSLKAALLGLTATGILFGTCRKELTNVYEIGRAKIVNLLTGKNQSPVLPQSPVQTSSGLQLMDTPMENITHLRFSHTQRGIEYSSMQGPPLLSAVPHPSSELPFLPFGKCIDIHMGEGEIAIDVPSGLELSPRELEVMIGLSGWNAPGAGMDASRAIIIHRGASHTSYLIRHRKQPGVVSGNTLNRSY